MRILAALFAAFYRPVTSFSPLPASEVRKVWVWPAEQPGVSRVGFVGLSFREGTLRIDLVEKPSHLPVGSGFCTNALSSSVNAFLRFVDLRGIEAIEVFNDANPKIIGCRCYVRLMVNMGFNQINSVFVNNTGVVEFCNNNNNLFFIRGIKSLYGMIKAPIVSDSAAQLFRASFEGM
jgi:hypothetical protein